MLSFTHNIFNQVNKNYSPVGRKTWMMVNMMVSVIHHLFPDLERGNSRRRHIFALYLHSSPPQCSVTFSEEEQEIEFKWLTFRDHRHFRTSRQGNVDKIHCCQGNFYVQDRG